MQTKRTNVVGDGPRRQFLPSFRRLGDVDPRLLELALAEIAAFEREGAATDCCTDIYPISHGNVLNETFGPLYQQRLLQLAATDGGEENDYTVPRGEVGQRLIEWLPKAGLFRARLAKLLPGEVADWHIDTNTSVACRIQIMIGGESTWLIRRSADHVDTQRMVAGEVWFANTGFPHRIENHGTEPRWVLIAGCSYGGLAAQFGDFKMTEATR